MGLDEIAAAAGKADRPARQPAKSALWLVRLDGGSEMPVWCSAVMGPGGPAGPLLCLAEDGQVVAAFAAGEWDWVVMGEALMQGEMHRATSGDGRGS